MLLAGVSLKVFRIRLNLQKTGRELVNNVFTVLVLPMGLIATYATVMETYHPVKCWKDYSERPELWILLVPILLALSVSEGILNLNVEILEKILTGKI